MSEPTADETLERTMRSRWSEVFPDPAHLATYAEVWHAYAGGELSEDATGRHYHGPGHVLDCLDQARLCQAELEDVRAVEAAIWFHDVIYDPRRPDNEARSADRADECLRSMGEPAEFVARVHHLILDTRHTAPPSTRDGEYLVDIDLSILGRDAEVFDVYDRAIRREYAHVPEEAYRSGRAGVLRSFLAREFIYHTKIFRDRYESQARANLSHALTRLLAPPSEAGA
jgi:predicted metal-dependent HD superfamily phosphohydrolase